jgi:hypothetical protein
MKRIVFSLAILSFSMIGLGQNLRFGMELGAAVPLADFAKSDTHPENGGFAVTGFDMKFVGERIFENHFVTGVTVGFSMFGIDKSALKSFINPSSPDLVSLETNAFQNINLQFRGGYDWNVGESNLHVIPNLAVGLGIFNSAYYAIQVAGGETYLRNGNTGLAILVTPGLDLVYMVNDFVGIKVYGNYQFANYSVDEQFKVLGGNPDIIYQSTVDYKYSSANFGIGANVTL